MIVIGDRYLTDIVFGNLYGMLTIHVDPFTLQGENLAVLLVKYNVTKLI